MSLNLGTLPVNPNYSHQENRHHEVSEGESGLAITEPNEYLLELHEKYILKNGREVLRNLSVPIYRR